MDRRTLLVVLGAGLAGCTGGETVTGSSPTSAPSPSDTETPPGTATPPETATDTDTLTETDRRPLPVIRVSSVTPGRAYRGESIPKGTTLIVDVTYDIRGHDGTARGEIDVDIEPPSVSQVDVDEEVELAGDGRLTGEYRTTIEAPGTAGEFLVTIMVSDLIAGRTTDPAEHTISVVDE